MTTTDPAAHLSAAIGGSLGACAAALFGLRHGCVERGGRAAIHAEARSVLVLRNAERNQRFDIAYCAQPLGLHGGGDFGGGEAATAQDEAAST